MTQLGYTTSLAGIVATVIIAISLLLVWRSRERKSLPVKRHLTIRIDDIPVDTTRDALARDLKWIVDQSSGTREETTVVHHHLVRRDQNFASATATFYTSVSAIKLIKKLHQARTGHQYRFDIKFHGITPLYEDAQGVGVE